VHDLFFPLPFSQTDDEGETDMSNFAILVGGNLSANHLTHVRHSCGVEPQALETHAGMPTVNNRLLGTGRDTLYICGHGSPGTLAGNAPNDLLTKLYLKGLDSSKFNTIFLFACNSAAHVADVQGYDGQTFAQQFFGACQAAAVFKGITVKAFTGVLVSGELKVEGKEEVQITGEWIVAPNGERRTLEQGMVVLSPAGGSYVPPQMM
jgi:hypothetical protein